MSTMSAAIAVFLGASLGTAPGGADPRGPTAGAAAATPESTGNVLASSGGAPSGAPILQQTIRAVDRAGRITVRTFEIRLVTEQHAGNAIDLPTVAQTQRQDGRFVRVVQDVTGRLISLLLDPSGRVLDARPIPPDAQTPEQGATTPAPIPAAPAAPVSPAALPR